MRPSGRDPRAFVGADLDALAAQLQAAGFTHRATIEPGEVARFGRGDALIVLYRDGRVSARGSSWQAAHHILLSLCEDA